MLCLRDLKHRLSRVKQKIRFNRVAVRHYKRLNGPVLPEHVTYVLTGGSGIDDFRQKMHNAFEKLVTTGSNPPLIDDITALQLAQAMGISEREFNYAINKNHTTFVKERDLYKESLLPTWDSFITKVPPGPQKRARREASRRLMAKRSTGRFGVKPEKGKLSTKQQTEKLLKLIEEAFNHLSLAHEKITKEATVRKMKELHPDDKDVPLTIDTLAYQISSNCSVTFKKLHQAYVNERKEPNTKAFLAKLHAAFSELHEAKQPISVPETYRKMVKMGNMPQGKDDDFLSRTLLRQYGTTFTQQRDVFKQGLSGMPIDDEARHPVLNDYDCPDCPDWPDWPDWPELLSFNTTPDAEASSYAGFESPRTPPTDLGQHD